MNLKPARAWKPAAGHGWVASVAVAGALALALVLGIVWHSLRRPPQPGSGDVPDFSVYATPAERKHHFFEWLRPIVETENCSILEKRQRLENLVRALASNRDIGWFNRHWIIFMAERYNVDTGGRSSTEIIQTLLHRVDALPASLVLVQAAKESAWGRSRFAVHGNNLFGQHCFDSGCGIIPKDRAPQQRHEVEAFDSVRDAVASYLLNLNSHPRYAELRAIRTRLRMEEKPITGIALADGLVYYSERRNQYIQEVKSMIANNHLALSATAVRQLRENGGMTAKPPAAGTTTEQRSQSIRPGSGG